MGLTFHVATEEIRSDLSMGTDSFLSPRGLKTVIKHNKLILVQPWLVSVLNSVFGTKIL